jgi:alpha-amylase
MIDGFSSANLHFPGTWQGLINHLDYIQGMGFTAIWISPIVKNVEGVTTDGDSYHGYWAQKIVRSNSNKIISIPLTFDNRTP